MSFMMVLMAGKMQMEILIQIWFQMQLMLELGFLIILVMEIKTHVLQEIIIVHILTTPLTTASIHL